MAHLAFPPDDATTTPTGADRLQPRIVAPVLATIFADLLGLTILLPLLALYAASFGAGPVAIGLMQAAYPLAQFLAAPLFGALSDRYGRKPILLASQLVSLVGLLALGFAGSLWMLILARAVAGIGAGNIATAQAALSDVTGPRTRTQGLALLGAAYGLGFIVGPALASLGLTLSGGNYQVPALIAAGCLGVAVLLTATVFRETLPAARRTATPVSLATVTGILPAMVQALRRPVVGVLLIVIGTQQMLFSLVETFFATLTLARVGLGGAGTALIFVLVGILSLVMQAGLMGPLSRRFGERTLVLAGLLALALGIGLLGVTPTQVLPAYTQAAVVAELTGAAADTAGAHQTAPLAAPPDSSARGYLGLAWLLLAMVPVVVGVALLQPNSNSLITQHVAPQEYGSILGISASYLSLGNVVGPLVGGVIYQLGGLTVLYVGGGLLVFAIFLLARRSITSAAPPAAETMTEGMR
jgi:DHA1 family tetracycline resistance protein-like MFS transporter